MRILFIIVLLFPLVALAESAVTTIGDVTLEPVSVDALGEKAQAFARKYEEAIKASDINALLTTLHPSSRQCINEKNTEFFTESLERRMKKMDLSGGYTVSLAEAVMVLPGMAKQGIYYPKNKDGSAVQPTHTFAFNAGNYHAILQLKEENGVYYEVMACPTDEGLVAFEERKKRKAERRAKIAKLYKELQDPLRSEIMEKLKEGKKVSAINFYKERSGEDLLIAKRVIERLQKEIQ